MAKLIYNVYQSHAPLHSSTFQTVFRPVLTHMFDYLRKTSAHRAFKCISSYYLGDKTQLMTG